MGATSRTKLTISFPDGAAILVGAGTRIGGALVGAMFGMLFEGGMLERFAIGASEDGPSNLAPSRTHCFSLARFSVDTLFPLRGMSPVSTVSTNRLPIGSPGNKTTPPFEPLTKSLKVASEKPPRCALIWHREHCPTNHGAMSFEKLIDKAELDCCNALFTSSLSGGFDFLDWIKASQVGSSGRSAPSTLRRWCDLASSS